MACVSSTSTSRPNNSPSSSTEAAQQSPNSLRSSFRPTYELQELQRAPELGKRILTTASGTPVEQLSARSWHS